MNRARTVPLKVGAGGHVSLAHPRAEPGELRGGGPAGWRYIVAVDGVPSTVHPAAVLLAYAAVAVHWPAGTAPVERRVSWGEIAWRGRGAIIRPERRP